MELDAEACYRIIQARDARFDGAFFTAVLSTGIYCRPVCPARTPKRENVRFYACAASAEAHGFRPCKRCRPETAPGTPAWNGTSTTVNVGLRLIGSGFLDEHTVPELASLLGMGERHMRRLFLEHVGAAPSALAKSRRAHFAACMLRDTDLPLSHVALSAGFGSVRQFNDVFRSVFGEQPSSMREARTLALARRSKPRTLRAVTLTVSYRPPYAWDEMLSFFRTRAIRGVEEVTDDVYRRSISLGESTGVLEVQRAARGNNCVTVRFSGVEPAVLGVAVRRVRRMFDLDADPKAIADHLSRDARLAPLVREMPGMRIPATWDVFESAVRAVLGQHVSVSGAITIAGRLVERHGRAIEGAGAIARVFPGAAELAHVDVSGIGVPRSRAQTLITLARAVASGKLRFDGFAPREQLIEDLTAIPGIGPWSAHYIALRGQGEPDAFPDSDLGIRKALDALGFPAGHEERANALRALSPWRGYAAVYLWSSLAGGG